MTYAKALFSILIFCLFGSKSHAQSDYWWLDKQEIATDYNTCLQGIKDSLGNWVIQPQYESIEESNSRYIVQSSGKYGLLNRSGKQLIPPHWDYLNSVDDWYFANGLADCYDVLRNGKWGVLDSAGRVIVPVEYINVKGNYDSSFVAEKAKKRYDFYNFAGERYECPWKSKTPPYHDGNHTFIVQRRALFGIKYGMVNDTGKIIFGRKYDQLYNYNGRDVFKIAKGGKYGYCSSAGKMFWPMIFENTPQNQYSGLSDNYVAEYGIGPACKGGKCGLITLDGKVILPFEYDYIIPFDEYSAPHIWQVGVGMLSGIYDIKKGWLLQPKCLEMFSINTYSNASDSSVTALLIANQDGKWGAMTSSGQSVIPFECENMLMTSRSCYVFQKGDSLLALTLPTFNEIQYYRSDISKIEPLIVFYFEGYGIEMLPGTIPASNQFSVFKGKNGVRSFYNPEQTKDTMRNDSLSFVISQGKYYGRSVPDSIVVSSVFSVIPLIRPVLDHQLFDFYGEVRITNTDSAWSSPEICMMQKNSKPVMMRIDHRVYNPEGSAYYITAYDDLLKEDGSIILSGDTMHVLDDERHDYDGSLYFTNTRYTNGFEMCAYDTNGKMVHPYIALEFEDFTSDYTWADSKEKNNRSYQLIDNKTGLNVLGKKVFSESAYPIWDSITMVETKKQGVRLYNIKQRKYLTTLGFDEIVPLRKDGSLFGVKTCWGHLGVVDATGKVIIDTLYTAIIQVNASEYFYTGSRFRSDFYAQFYRNIIFYNETSQVQLDVVTGKVIAHPDYVEEIWNISAIGVETTMLDTLLANTFYEYRNRGQYLLVFMQGKDSVAMLPWQKRCLVDSMYTPIRSDERYWSYSNRKCDYCRKHNRYNSGVDWTRHSRDMVNHVVGFRSDSLLCFARFTDDGYLLPIEKQGFSTVMMFSDGIHQITLDSLFNPTTDWRNFIINTLITYVNTHQGIEGDCHNPAAIPLMLNDQFELTPEGLILYPKDFEEQRNQLVLTIPWSDVDSYLRKDIKSKLPIDKH